MRDALLILAIVPLLACASNPPRELLRCGVVDSDAEDSAPVQPLSAWPAPGSELSSWTRPTRWTALELVRGTVGRPADHEGDDYINANTDVVTVAVVAAAAGTVVYARRGCPQSTVFAPNKLLRECSAGWGNHVIVRHRNNVYTRYAHLATIIVTSGDEVVRGQPLGTMGNSGRSDVRHLHFELGTRSVGIDACGPAQSFDAIYEASKLVFAP
ncbi:MAG: M23 family metallopeptidase [Deltaproteobacteria bacterium]|nr:M23 family metallopeptidase [Deltaproteobacteria bacterium]